MSLMMLCSIFAVFLTHFDWMIKVDGGWEVVFSCMQLHPWTRYFNSDCSLVFLAISYIYTNLLYICNQPSCHVASKYESCEYPDFLQNITLSHQYHSLNVIDAIIECQGLKPAAYTNHCRNKHILFISFTLCTTLYNLIHQSI